MKQEFEIEKIRKIVAELQKTLNWYQERSIHLAYDWDTYGHPKIMELLKLCKVGFDGEIKKKDKRGYWK